MEQLLQRDNIVCKTGILIILIIINNRYLCITLAEMLINLMLINLILKDSLLINYFLY